MPDTIKALGGRPGEGRRTTSPVVAAARAASRTVAVAPAPSRRRTSAYTRSTGSDRTSVSDGSGRDRGLHRGFGASDPGRQVAVVFGGVEHLRQVEPASGERGQVCGAAGAPVRCGKGSGQQLDRTFPEHGFDAVGQPAALTPFPQSQGNRRGRDQRRTGGLGKAVLERRPGTVTDLRHPVRGPQRQRRERQRFVEFGQACNGGLTDVAVGVERSDRESQKGGLALHQPLHRDRRPARSLPPRTTCRHIEHEPQAGGCSQQELSGFGKQLGVTGAVNGEQQTGQFIGLAATRGLNGGCRVAELLRGWSVGQVVIGQVRWDAENVGAGTESPQQLLSKAAGHGTPFRFNGLAARAAET